MRKAVAIEGAKITVASVIEGVQITGKVVIDAEKSKPSEKVLVDGKGAYFGNLHCIVTNVIHGVEGIQDSTIEVKPEITPRSEYFFENGKAAILLGDENKSVKIPMRDTNNRPYEISISVSSANQEYLFAD